MSSGRLLYWLPNADLRKKHDGLTELVRKEFKMDVRKLKPGDMIIFINSRWTQFIVYCSNNIILHYKQPEGKHLNPKALMLIPHFMKGQKIDYSSALREVIEKEFETKYPKIARSLPKLGLVAKK